MGRTELAGIPRRSRAAADPGTRPTIAGLPVPRIALQALPRRQQEVLQATVRHYVDTMEPVGSSTLVRRFGLPASPATVRSAMGALELKGLLTQPHPSAGRVPSQLGYRHYVNCLLPAPGAAAGQLERELAGLSLQWAALDDLLLQLARRLADLTGLLSLITRPQRLQPQLQALRLVLAQGTYLPPEALRQPGSGVDAPPATPEPAPSSSHSPNWPQELSPRQLAVLRCLLQGKPNKVIAREIGIAEGTVKAHLWAVYQLLGVNNRAQAMYRAHELQLFSALRPPAPVSVVTQP